jgi:hypothetical protein
MFVLNKAWGSFAYSSQKTKKTAQPQAAPLYQKSVSELKAAKAV